MGERHIAKVARNIIGLGSFHWRVGRPFGKEFSAQTLYEFYAPAVRCEVRIMQPETLGRIVVQGLAMLDPRTESTQDTMGVVTEGKTSLYAVHAGAYLDEQSSGRNILVELAVTALIAEIADQLRERMHREASLEPLTTEGM